MPLPAQWLRFAQVAVKMVGTKSHPAAASLRKAAGREIVAALSEPCRLAALVVLILWDEIPKLAIARSEATWQSPATACESAEVSP